MLDFRFSSRRMSIISRSISAIGKLATLGLLLLAFVLGMTGVVYMSLSGDELKVPEIVGKDFVESEKELAALGLKIKKRADRVSSEPMNTVLEQLPKAGETVKTGQLILVVVSKAGSADEEPPPSLEDIDTDDSEKIEEMISDKPKKKTNSNTNKKKADTTRDVISDGSDSNTSTDSKEVKTPKTDDTEKKDPAEKKESPAATTSKPPSSPPSKPGNEPRPKP